jgi:hypothetical protein
VRSEKRQQRQRELLNLIQSDPLMSDSELARALQASVATIRLDRTLLNVPELRNAPA